MDNMDRIYGGAALTIVAADDHNAHGHLRAIDNHPVGRAPQPKETIYGQDWTVSKSLYDRLHNSPYVTRGWTYQELILSHRCLIFVNGLSYFRCASACTLRTTSSSIRMTRHRPCHHARCLPDGIPAAPP